MTKLFDRIVVPVADPDDAAATMQALGDHEVGSALAIHVVEKAGGAPDKASVEQREEYAEEIFDAVREHLDDRIDLDTEIAYGTDVAETIFEVADEFDASAIVISTRSGSRWIRLLTGDVALSLVTETDRPVVVLPDASETDEPTERTAVDGESAPEENGAADEREPET